MEPLWDYDDLRDLEMSWAGTAKVRQAVLLREFLRTVRLAILCGRQLKDEMDGDDSAITNGDMGKMVFTEMHAVLNALTWRMRGNNFWSNNPKQLTQTQRLQRLQKEAKALGGWKVVPTDELDDDDDDEAASRRLFRLRKNAK